MALFEDKDVKIVSKEEALWIRVKESREARIKELQDDLIVEKAVLEMAKEKLKEEQNFQEQINIHNNGGTKKKW